MSELRCRSCALMLIGDEISYCVKCRRRRSKAVMQRVSGESRKIDYIPTPTEIAATCAEIREGWSKQRWANETGRADEMTARMVHDPRLNH